MNLTKIPMLALLLFLALLLLGTWEFARHKVSIQRKSEVTAVAPKVTPPPAPVVVEEKKVEEKKPVAPPVVVEVPQQPQSPKAITAPAEQKVPTPTPAPKKKAHKVTTPAPTQPAPTKQDSENAFKNFFNVE